MIGLNWRLFSQVSLGLTFDNFALPHPIITALLFISEIEFLFLIRCSKVLNISKPYIFV